MPKSCRAETIDQDFTPPVYSNTRLPLRRCRHGSNALLMRASSLAIRAGAFSEVWVVDQAGEIAQGIVHVLHPVEAAFNHLAPNASSSFSRHIEHGFGTYHHVHFGVVHGLHFVETRIAGEGAKDADAEVAEQWQDVPEFARDIVFADQIHIVDFEGVAFCAVGAAGQVRGSANVFHHCIAPQCGCQ